MIALRTFLYALGLIALGVGPFSAARGAPAIVAPVPGAQLTQSTTTFHWNANGTQVLEWWLYVGTTPGGSELYDSGSLDSSTLSATVSGLPTDGTPVWVRLWYDADPWSWVDFQYSGQASGGSSSGGAPEIVTPVPGAPLTQSTTTFQWDANGTAVSDWWLYVGTTPGGSELYDSGSLGSGTLSATVSGLPTNGTTVWVRLWYDADHWRWIDFQYPAESGGSGGGAPEIVAPVPGAPLTQSTTTFQWDANGTAVSEWWLYVGTTPGGSELYDSGSLGSGTLSATVSGLPTNGTTVWVRLWYDADHWRWIDFQYPAESGGSGGGAPEIVTPVPGAPLTQSTTTFQWDANGTAVSEWWLYVGTTPGGSELYDSGSLGSGTLSATVSGLPTDGTPVWVRLWYDADHWRWVDFRYPAETDSGGPEIVTPVPGTQLTQPTTTFHWEANGTTVWDWWLFVGTAPGANDLYDSGSLGRNALSTTASGLPTDGTTVWVRLWYSSDGWNWADYQYTGANGLSIVSPVENDLMDPTDVTVSATAYGFPQDWKVAFVIDGQYQQAVLGTYHPESELWKASLGDLDRSGHVLTAVMVDGNGAQTAHFDQVSFDVGDYYVAFGDSITEGIGDDIDADNHSLDGRNVGAGFAPILNDLLTQAKAYPHSVEVYGIAGYDSADGLLDIDDALAAHPEARYFLIQFGTNDSDPSNPIPSGLHLHPGDAGYPGTFKDNMQRILNAVRAAGKVPLFAKVPIRYGDCSGASGCPSYVQSGIAPEAAAANGFVREYNEVIDELIIENGLSVNPGSPLFIPPDFYSYFNNSGLDQLGKSPVFFDWLHPNGMGYQDMAELWRQSLSP